MTRLSVTDVCYLLGTLPLDVGTRRALERVPVPALDHLTEQQIDELRDLCGERLQSVGFDENYEPTEEGRALEGLIDKLMITSTREDSDESGVT